MEKLSKPQNRINIQSVKRVLFIAAVLIVLAMLIGLIKHFIPTRSSKSFPSQEVPPVVMPNHSFKKTPQIIKEDTVRIEGKSSTLSVPENPGKQETSKDHTKVKDSHNQNQANPVFVKKKIPRQKHVLASQQTEPRKVELDPPKSSKDEVTPLKNENGNFGSKKLCRNKQGVQIDIPVDWVKDTQGNCVPLRTAAQDMLWNDDCSGMDWLGCKNRCTQSSMNRRDCDELYGPGRFD